MSVAESCTGGGLGYAITSVPGSSQYFTGGVVAYSDVVKQELLDIPSGLLAQYGAVSPETAREMSRGICRLLHTDVGVSITGIAGPDGGTDDKPVGLVCISVTTPEKSVEQKFLFAGDRDAIRDQSIDQALELLSEMLK